MLWVTVPIFSVELVAVFMGVLTHFNIIDGDLFLANISVDIFRVLVYFFEDA